LRVSHARAILWILSEACLRARAPLTHPRRPASGLPPPFPVLNGQVSSLPSY